MKMQNKIDVYRFLSKQKFGKLLFVFFFIAIQVNSAPSFTVKVFDAVNNTPINTTAAFGFQTDGCRNRVFRITIVGNDLPPNGTINLNGTPISYYEFSLTNFGDPLNQISYNGTSIAETVYVRFKFGLPITIFNLELVGNISISVSGSSLKRDFITINTSYINTDNLQLDPKSLSGLTQKDCKSEAKGVNVSWGPFMPTPTSISLSLDNNNFECSLDNINFNNPSIFPASNAPGVFKIYVRLKPGIPVGNYSGILSLKASSCDIGVTLPISGNVPCPILLPEDPYPVCEPSTVDITYCVLPSDVFVSYWKDIDATVLVSDPASIAEPGTYFIKMGSSQTGCSDIKPVNVTIYPKPQVSPVYHD